jgi:hypothetical protein
MLSFRMTSNLVLTAHFAPNPFTTRTGTYQGLYFDDPPTVSGSGMITVNLTGSGAWSGTLRRGSSTARLAGTFGPEGHTAATTAFSNREQVTASLTLDLTPDAMTLTGSVTRSNGPAASALALRNYSNPLVPSPHAAVYSMLVLGGSEYQARFAGDGFGTIVVDPQGRATVTASLADLGKGAQKSALSVDGRLPLYFPLEGGFLAGWLQFVPSPIPPDNGLIGSVHWIKEGNAARPYYPGGFTNDVGVVGSRYNTGFWPGGLLLNLDGDPAQLDFEAPAGNPIYSELIHWTLDNQVSSAAGNPLTFRLTAKTGWFGGTWTVPTTGEIISFRGVLHQFGQYASGYWIRPHDTGWMGIHPTENFEAR